MKKFRFRLQKLLDIRESNENRIKNELASVLGLQNVERVKIDNINKNIGQQKRILSEKMRNSEISAEEAIRFERYIDSSLRAIDSTQVRIDELEPAVKEIRDRLTIASRDKKVVEKLKERQYEDYLYEVKMAEFKENDDMNQKMYARRKFLEVDND